MLTVSGVCTCHRCERSRWWLVTAAAICLKGRRGEFGPALEHAPDVVYVGRPCYQGGWRLPGSPFANPHTVQKVGGADRAVELYREHLRRRTDLVALARETLRGKRLGCWCQSGPCHAAALAAVVNGETP